MWPDGLIIWRLIAKAFGFAENADIVRRRFTHF
jgi:hypothetical protein